MIAVPMALRARRLPILVAALAGAAVLVPAAGARSQQTVLPTLYVDYAMNCTFTISDDNGRRVTSIAPGTYQIHVTSVVVFATVDLSDFNDFTACKGSTQFQLTGPGVSVFTTLQDGDEDKDYFKETFLPGSTYTAVDLNHPAVARAVFTTTSAGNAPNAPASPSAPSSSAGKPSTSTDLVGSAIKTYAFRGTLTATVDAAGKLRLLFNGRPVGSLKEGRYTTKVTDESRKAGVFFQLLNKSGAVVSTLTASNAPFVGKRSSSLTLRKGQWRFTPTAGGRRSLFAVVGG
jgi:hypothetical protein